MNVGHAASRLRSLASDNARRSKTAVLGDVLGDIEKAIRAGVSQVVIVEELRRLGLDINLTTFRSALRRLRARRGSAGSWTAPLAATDFAHSPFDDEMPPVRTTASGAMYDENALRRLLLASRSRREGAVTALAD